MQISEVTIGKIATITMGTSPKGETYNNEGIGIPLLNGPTEFGSIYPTCTLFTTDSKRDCKKDDLIFCVRGSTTGRMNWADKQYSLGRGVCSIRGATPMDTKYIRYCIELKLGALLKLSGGATFPNLTGNDLSTFPIPYSPHRHKIAAILSAYDDLIENNTQRIKILEEMAQALYRGWFVKFRFPGHEKVKMVESELGMVPEGWEIIKATDAIYVSPTTKVPKEGEKPFVSMGNLSNDSMFVNSFEYRSGNSGSKFKNGDTLFARITPCLENGKTAYVQFLPSNNDIAFGSTEFIVLRSKTLCSELVYLMARSNEFRDNAIKSMSGATGRQRVQEACFDRFLFAHPYSKIISAFAEHVSPLLQNAYILNKKSANLRRTRDLLLPKLISGEVDVEKIDVQMPENGGA